MFFLLGLLWFVRTAKIILFYIYLWQIKEYRLDRFREHFRTAKGLKLILNWIVLLKLALVFPFWLFLFVERGLYFLLIFSGTILFLYLAESFVFVKNVFSKDFKKPVWTKKAVVLTLTAFGAELLILFPAASQEKGFFAFAFVLLFFDILAPLVISTIVLFFQPLAVFLKSRLFLERAKNKIKNRKDLVVVGITGSYGKTATKEFLSVILSQKFKTLKTREHQNNETGVSQCVIKELKPEHEIFIVEMGAYNKGEIKLLSDIVRPKIGILTGINEQHIALFGSQKKIIETKYELIENLPQDGLAVFNGDNKYCLELYHKTDLAKKLYGTSKKADIRAENIEVKKDCLIFTIIGGKEKADFKVNVLGGQNVLNILAAAAAAQKLGMSLKEISKACLKIKPEQGAMKILKGKNDPYIIDSSYSANSDGVIADLDYLKIWPFKKAVAMPCLIELGSKSKEVHRRIGRKIGEVCDLAIITTGDRFKEIKQGALEAGMRKEDVLFIEKAEEIASQINVFSNPGDAVLLEGRAPKKIQELLNVSE